jgi:hypothetical protein
VTWRRGGSDVVAPGMVTPASRRRLCSYCSGHCTPVSALETRDGNAAPSRTALKDLPVPGRPRIPPLERNYAVVSLALQGWVVLAHSSDSAADESRGPEYGDGCMSKPGERERVGR